MTNTSGPPTVSEIAALTARLRRVSRPGTPVVDREAFMADKAELLDRIEKGRDDGSST